MGDIEDHTADHPHPEGADALRERVLAEARAEAEELLTAAHRQADRTRGDAQRDARELLDRARREVESLRHPRPALVEVADDADGLRRRTLMEAESIIAMAQEAAREIEQRADPDTALSSESARRLADQLTRAEQRAGDVENQLRSLLDTVLRLRDDLATATRSLGVATGDDPVVDLTEHDTRSS